MPNVPKFHILQEQLGSIGSVFFLHSFSASRISPILDLLPGHDPIICAEIGISVGNSTSSELNRLLSFFKTIVQNSPTHVDNASHTKWAEWNSE